MGDNHELERQLSEMLTEGELKEQQKREEKERELISPKYEIRIQTTMDPVVEETRIYRSMADELDDRYDKYMDKVPKPQQEDSTSKAKTDTDKM